MTDSQVALSPVQRVYAVGDVYGRYDLFRQLIAIIRTDQNERSLATSRIVLLGNIIDHGPDSAKMIRGCMNLTAATDRFVVLKGNHEDMMAEALAGNVAVYSNWLSFGGRDTLISWGVDRLVAEGPATIENLSIAAEAVGSEVLDWLAKLPLFNSHGDYLFVHAGIRPGVEIENQDPDDLLWITNGFLDSNTLHGVLVVHGHFTSENGPEFRHNRIGVPGAYSSRGLTALGLEGSKIWTLDTQSETSRVDARTRVGHV